MFLKMNWEGHLRRKISLGSGNYIIGNHDGYLYAGESGDLIKRINVHRWHLRTHGKLSTHDVDYNEDEFWVVFYNIGETDASRRVDMEQLTHTMLPELISMHGKCGNEPPCHKQLAEGRHPFQGRTKWRHPQATEQSLLIWSNSIKYHEFFLENGSKPVKCAKHFNVPRCKPLQNMFSDFKNGWNPNIDKEFIEWLESYNE